MSFERSVARAPLAILGLLALAVGLASSAVSAPRVRLRVTVFPRQLPSPGGQIHILVNSGGVPLDDAFATIVRPDRTPITEELAPTGQVGQFQTFVTLPENEGRAAQTYSIRVFARGEAERGHTASGGTVRVKGATETDPLIITECSVLPREIPPAGGSFVVAARIRGLRRLQVEAHVTGSGLDLQLPMTLRAGAYRTSATVPPNTSQEPNAFQVRVVATPAEGSPVEADCGGLTQAAPDSTPGIAVTGNLRGLPVLRLFNGETGAQVDEYFPFDTGVEGDATVVAGDFTGDGVPDFAFGAGPGSPPLVRVAEGPDFEPIAVFAAYDPSFLGGVNVAAGDVNGDGHADLVTGPGAGGGPHVKVFDGRTGQLLTSFLAYDAAFAGGVRVAVGDVNGDGRADVITGAGAGGGPHVKVFDGRTLNPLRSFNAYEPSFAGGVYVAAGDVNGDGRADLITGAGPGGGPQVKVFDGRNGRPLQSFLAYDSGFRGGVRVAAGDLDGDGRTDVISGGGSGAIGGHVKVFCGATGAELRSFLPFDSNFTSGVGVAGVTRVRPAPQSD